MHGKYDAMKFSWLIIFILTLSLNAYAQEPLDFFTTDYVLKDEKDHRIHLREITVRCYKENGNSLKCRVFFFTTSRNSEGPTEDGTQFVCLIYNFTSDEHFEFDPTENKGKGAWVSKDSSYPPPCGQKAVNKIIYDNGWKYIPGPPIVDSENLKQDHQKCSLFIESGEKSYIEEEDRESFEFRCDSYKQLYEQ